jgi:hypothetical protein
MDNILVFDYNDEVTAEPTFAMPEPGKYRVRFSEVKIEPVTLSSGETVNVLKTKLDMSGSTSNIFHDVWLQSGMKVSKAGNSYDAGEFTSRALKQIYNSFAKVEDGEKDLGKWVGAVGAADIAIKGYVKKDGTDGKKVEVKRWLPLDEQDELPAWGVTQTVEEKVADAVGDDTIPFAL